MSKAIPFLVLLVLIFGSASHAEAKVTKRCSVAEKTMKSLDSQERAITAKYNKLEKQAPAKHQDPMDFSRQKDSLLADLAIKQMSARDNYNYACKGFVPTPQKINTFTCNSFYGTITCTNY